MTTFSFGRKGGCHACAHDRFPDGENVIFVSETDKDMEKFEKVTKPLALDFYSISEDNGVKFIHVNGYSYKSDSMEYVSEENPDGTYWANMECCWFIEQLEEFIKKLHENENYIDDTYCDLNQYQGDHSENEMVDIINHYFDGKPADFYLPFGEITMDTPCGNYVSKS